MKKLFAFLVTVVLCAACAFGVAGCDKKGGHALSVYVPDGAPALALSPYMDGGYFESQTELDFHVVDASTIQTYVAGENPTADLCVMPVNAAVKLLGSGEKYKTLGTLTHGNLFLMKKQSGEDISTPDDLSKLVGKTVGIINLVNVPGLTFKVILADNNIEYNELKDGASAATDKVNLIDVAKEEVIPSNSTCDYFVVPEPAASTKVAATQGKLDFAGNLQTLYGGDDGYPQAVLVAKNSVIDSDASFIEDFMRNVDSSCGIIKNDCAGDAEKFISAINSHITAGSASSLNAQNLTQTVIDNCGLAFTGNADGKQSVHDFMQKFNAVSNNAWGMPAEAFFY